MIELFPEGFEELGFADGVELAAYTSPAGEERLWQAFGSATTQDVESGWADAWRSFHRPTRVGPLWIGPPWETPDAEAVAVVIDPGLAFGTGSHPTTRLCLELLLESEPSSLIDVGCGSGVLAIAAAKLGHAPVYALDLEAAAVEATLTNAAANGVTIEASRLDASVDPLPHTELAVANITHAAVWELLPRLPARQLIASGYLASEQLSPRGWSQRDRRELDGWAADLIERSL